MNELEEKAVSLLRGYIEEVGGGRASLHVRRANDPISEGSVIEVIPANPRASQIVVDLDFSAPVITVSIGEGTIHEIWAGRPGKTPSRDWENGLRDICTAVIAGQFTESVWVRGGQVVRAIGTMRTACDEITRKSTWHNPFAMLLPTQKRTTDYVAYTF